MSKMSDERIKEFADRVKPLSEKILALLGEYPEFDHIYVGVTREKNWIDITAGSTDEDGVGNVSIYSYDGQPEKRMIDRSDWNWENWRAVE